MLRVFLISEGGNEWVYASQCAERQFAQLGFPLAHQTCLLDLYMTSYTSTPHEINMCPTARRGAVLAGAFLETIPRPMSRHGRNNMPDPRQNTRSSLTDCSRIQGCCRFINHVSIAGFVRFSVLAPRNEMSE